MSVRRAIELKGLDKTLELSKVTCIKGDRFNSIHLDKLDNGTWRMIYSDSVIDDIQKLESLTIIREE